MNEVEYLSALANSRFNFLCGSAHGMSYLLDPLLLGDGLPAAQIHLIENEICELPVDDAHPENNEERKQALYAEYTSSVIACRAELAVGTFQHSMLKDKTKTVFQFWQVDGCRWPLLQPIALPLFAMATSSTASERNFSTMGFVHSKLRNSLKTSTVEKLVFMKTNMSALFEQLCRFDDDLPDDDKENTTEADEIDSDGYEIGQRKRLDLLEEEEGMEW